MAARGTRNLASIAVVLPTKRLAQWLTALLTPDGAALIPPRLFNWDSWLEEHAARPDDPGLLPDLDAELLLAALIRDGGYRHLRLGHEHEIKQLFAEIIDWEVEDQGFARLREALEADAIRAEEGLRTIEERIEELEDLHSRFWSTLNEAHLWTGSRRRAALSERLADLWREEIPYERVYVGGFTSLAPCHDALLRTMSDKPNVRVWVSEPPVKKGARKKTSLDPIERFLEIATGREPPPGRPPSRTSRLRVHACPTPLTETAQALALVEDALAQGAVPSEIAILVTDEKAYGPCLRTLLPRVSFQANVALAAPLAEAPLGSWLRALLLVLEEETPGRLTDFLAHPLTEARLRDGLDEEGISTSSLGTKLIETVCRLGVPRGLEPMLRLEERDSPEAKALALAYELLAPMAEASELSLSESEWTQRFRQVLAGFGLENAKSGTIPVALLGSGTLKERVFAQSSIECLNGLLTAFARLDRLFGTSPSEPESGMSQSEFLAVLGEKIASLEIRDVGEPLRGVQVLGLEEARYVPFRYAMILGCTEGQFPRALPKDHVLDNHLKSRLGLPGWALLEAIEDTTFRLLTARLPAIELFYPEARNGEPAVRSRFVERLLLEGNQALVRHGRDEAFRLLLQDEASDVGDVLAALANEAEGQIEGLIPSRDLFERLSPTSVERFLRCPYRFLLAQLGVRELKPPTEEDLRAEGEWLHQIVEAFFAKDALGEPKLSEVPDPATDPEGFEKAAIARLTSLTDALAPRHLANGPMALHLQLKSWPAFARHLRKVYETSWRDAPKGYRELKLDAKADEGLERSLDGVLDKLVGRVDAVDWLDRSQGLFLVTDYKRKSLPEAKDFARGLSPQLPLYALALGREDGEREALDPARAVLGYFSLIQAEWRGVAAGEKAHGLAKDRGLVSSKAPYLEEVLEKTRELMAWRRDEIAKHGFRVDASSERSCELCDVRGVCRARDPRRASLMEERRALETRFGSGEATEEAT